MTEKAIKVLMNVLLLAGAITLFAAAMGVWESLHGRSPWGAVGLLILLAAALIVPALVLDRVGRRMNGGRVDWWRDQPVQLSQAEKPTPAKSSASGASASADKSADFAAFAQDALAQQILDVASSKMSGATLLATDGRLHTYWVIEAIKWRKVWKTADMRASGVPLVGVRPFWVPDGPGSSLVPSTVLAFLGSDVRLRLAEDPEIDTNALEILADDPDPQVRRAAATNRAAR